MRFDCMVISAFCSENDQCPTVFYTSVLKSLFECTSNFLSAYYTCFVPSQRLVYQVLLD